MPEAMKELTTPEYAEICVRVPVVFAERIRMAIDSIMALVETEIDDDNRLYSIEEVFPDMHVGDILRGARYREELTQAQLAAKVGVKVSHISEMERGKRPIGKEMAKRLAKALNTSYKVFL
jgi:DNA-binding XRE family transcriptional regulator